jgi:DNA-binding response OmpR family regulator
MGEPLRVLIVEDSENDAELILYELKQNGYEPVSERVDTAKAMSAAFDAGNWDIVLSDYAMPHFSGLNALKLLQAKGPEKR